MWIWFFLLNSKRQQHLAQHRMANEAIVFLYSNVHLYTMRYFWRQLNVHESNCISVATQVIHKIHRWCWKFTSEIWHARGKWRPNTKIGCFCLQFRCRYVVHKLKRTYKVAINVRHISDQHTSHPIDHHRLCHTTIHRIDLLALLHSVHLAGSTVTVDTTIKTHIVPHPHHCTIYSITGQRHRRMTKQLIVPIKQVVNSGHTTGDSLKPTYRPLDAAETMQKIEFLEAQMPESEITLGQSAFFLHKFADALIESSSANKEIIFVTNLLFSYFIKQDDTHSLHET